MVISEMGDYGHEQVTFVSDDGTGLRSIIAIHDTTLGPSLGGTRLRPYESEEAALRDVLRLSQAMTYKAAAADLDLGGGKAVVIANPNEKTPELMRSYGEAVDWLGGRYITSVDMNTDVDDMEVIAEVTDNVVGREDGLGDPSPVTAEGVFSGIRACVEHVYGSPDLDNRHVVIQGIGKVGRGLATRLVDAGAEVTVSDIDAEKVDRFSSEYDLLVIDPEHVYDEPCDVFAPCAIGGVLNDDTIERLACDVVAGGANNVLESRRHAQALKDRDILYAPDYVINAGGLITVAAEADGGTLEGALADARQIGDRLIEMFEVAEAEDITVVEAADHYAEARLAAGC